MPLYLDTGFHSSGGTHREDEPCQVLVPNAEHDAAHGALLAIADGIAELPSPETAAHDVLKTLGEHYYTAPENWGLKHTLRESIAAANRSLIATGERGRAAALSALVLRRRRWAIAHAGHARVWLMRDNELKLLTRDHVTPRMKRAPFVDRACGLASKLEADFLSGEIAEGDVFVLTNRDTHDALNGSDIMACVMVDVPAAQTAGLIVDRARAAGAGAHAYACVARVEQVPPESEVDLEEDIAALPAIAPPEAGDVVDGFRIKRLVHKSSRYRLYKAVDTENDQVVALKFPNPSDANSPEFAERFLREEWIGRRVSSAHLVRTLSLQKGRRTVLYTVMAYSSNETLAKRLARKGTLSLRETAFLGGQLLEALAELHDQGVIHNDVRPQNIVLEPKTKRLMLLGLGSSHVTHTGAGEKTAVSTSRRGSFLAPELFERGVEPSVRSDVFAAGVTLYRMLTGSYPYGKISSSNRAPRGHYVPATRRRADVPESLDAVLQRACELNPNDRFESAQELAEALEAVVAHEIPTHKRANPAARRWSWEIAAIAGMIAVLVIYLIFTLRR